jgi:isopenicillin N synthase-like dioxygenase
MSLPSSFHDAPRLPVIDVSAATRSTELRAHVAAQIDWALAEFGFFYVTGHGIRESDVARLFDLGREFFALDAAVKASIRMPLAGVAWRGWFPVGDELTSGYPDAKEGIYFGEDHAPENPRLRAGVPMHGRNLYPTLPGFAEAVQAYLRELTSLGQRLMSLVAVALGEKEDDLRQRLLADPTILFRIFHYPAFEPGQGDAKWSVGAHTDYGLLTILAQDDVGGLQVEYRGQWLDVPYIPGTFVCNAGDMLETLSRGRYVSALHRVLNTSGRSRYSMPFFFDPSFDAVLTPFPARGDASPAAARERWDGRRLEELHGTYGEYLLSKVEKVFPELAKKL